MPCISVMHGRLIAEFDNLTSICPTKLSMTAASLATAWNSKSRLFLVALVLMAASTSCTGRRELGNVLRTAIREKYKTLDPQQASDFYSHTEVARAYEGLLHYHYLKRPYVIEPLLAESMPTVSKDGLIYTFRLKADVRFQDDKAFAPDGKGRAVVAADFVYSFKRLADPRLQSEGFWTLDRRILGLNEWREAAAKSGKADYSASVAGLQSPDDHTLVLKLTRPDPLILHVLTTQFASVVAREVVDYYGLEFRSHPVGTGPFRLESVTPNQLIWVRNPGFRQETYPSEGGPGDKDSGLLADAGKRIPFVDKLIDDIIIEDQPAWLNFMQGNHDFAQKINKDNAADVFDAERKPKKEIRDQGIQVLTAPGIWYYYLCFNMDDPVVGGAKNKFLREAMSLALDEAPMIDKFYLGLATKAEGPIPPGIAGYDPSFKNPLREYNLVKAREIMAKAGHPNGEGIPEITFDVKTDITQRQIAEYIQRSMAELGVKIKLNIASWPEMLGRIRRKQAQMFYISWVYDYPDAENSWQLLYSRNESPGPNEANYKNPRYDALYEKIAAMRDGPERFALFAKMRQFLIDDVPWVFVVHPTETRMAHRWVRNFKINAFEHVSEKYLKLDTQERSKALR